MSTMTTEHALLINLMKTEISTRGLSVRAFAASTGLPHRSVQNILDGKEPKLGRAAELCHALDLEFYIGPRRGAAKSSAKAGLAGGTPALAENQIADIKNWLANYLEAGLVDVVNHLQPPTVNPGHQTALPANGPAMEIISADQLNGHMPDFVALPQIGRGKGNLPMAFHKDWLEYNMLDPKKLACFQALDDSMAPVIITNGYAIIDTGDKEVRGMAALEKHDGSIWLSYTQCRGNYVNLYGENKFLAPKIEMEREVFNRDYTIVGAVVAALCNTP